MESVIDVEDTTGVAKFLSKEIVFRIIINTIPIIDVGVATTFDDYQKKYQSHEYTPLLSLCGLPLRLAYLYGCLNFKKDDMRPGFTFLMREIGKNIWSRWFTVHPYKDPD